ncbi:MAG: hypothetical protein OEM49_11430 [Myxococcales bacterium]|nr:hypothetical protein [Myxococcales bacterium]MDH5307232.1 hypothetical protein [Myxococcales bacterium]MDH5566846.1 hypothetical protein [Myxococcales bacterium]
MNARMAIAWLGTLALAFGLGWWAASPRAADPSAMAESLDAALEERNPLERARQLSDLFEGLNTENVGDALAVIEREPRMTDGDIYLFMYAWTRFDPEGAFARSRKSSQQMLRRRGSAAATYYWAMDNPKAALYWVETIEDTAFREFLTEYLITGWALSTERDSAAIYISKLPRSRLRQAQTSVIMAQYMKDGPEAVMHWAESLPEDISESYRHEVFQRAANQIALRDPELSARWIGQHVGKSYARSTIRPVAKKWFKLDPRGTVEWLVSLPSVPQTNRVMSYLMGRWYDEDAGAATRWIEAETLTPSHDPAIDAFARRLSKSFPRKALQWAEMIQDATRRERSLVAVGQNWFRQTPEAARAWLATSGLSASARDEVLNPPAEEPAEEEEDADAEEDESVEIAP